jgi:hypothetical protein
MEVEIHEHVSPVNYPNVAVYNPPGSRGVGTDNWPGMEVEVIRTTVVVDP